MDVDQLNLYLDSFYRAVGIPEAGEGWAVSGLLILLFGLLTLLRKETPQRLTAARPAPSFTAPQPTTPIVNETPVAVTTAPEVKIERTQEVLQPVEQEKKVVVRQPTMVEEARVEERSPAPPPPSAPAVSAYSSGLEKTRRSFLGRLGALFSRGSAIDEAALSDLEEQLVLSDLGIRTTQSLIGELKQELQARREFTVETLREALKARIRNILGADVGEIKPLRRDGKPLFILVVGVNGVGKTTTIGKLAQRFSAEGAKVLIAACDTFRAAAVDQLSIWAKRSDAVLVSGAENAKPATVAFQAIERGNQGDIDVIIVDTAGRLHTRVNLMNELGGVLKIIEKQQPGAPHETILVVDAATGQNALEQAREFHRAVKLTGIVVTKLDGTPKGGIVVAIKNELGIPIRYVGVGEQAADLKVFSPEEFTDALFDETTTDARQSHSAAA